MKTTRLILAVTLSVSNLCHGVDHNINLSTNETTFDKVSKGSKAALIGAEALGALKEIPNRSRILKEKADAIQLQNDAKKITNLKDLVAFAKNNNLSKEMLDELIDRIIPKEKGESERWTRHLNDTGRWVATGAITLGSGIAGVKILQYYFPQSFEKTQAATSLTQATRH